VRQTIQVAISESDFLGQVIELARVLGWFAHHVRPAFSKRGWRTPVQGDVGFLDLVLVSGVRGRVIFAEVKSEKGRLTYEQKAWIAALKDAGQEVYVWKPSDWERIAEIVR